MHGQCTATQETASPPHMARQRQYLQSQGKIARLPHAVRAQLHVHMQDGWPGDKLLTWLHAQPEVIAILAEHFGGKLITHQNLSKWRHGQHLAWLRTLERREILKALRS